MFANQKNFKNLFLVTIWLFVVLFLASSASAADLDKVNDRQMKSPLPPISYTFEGVLLFQVLNAAAETVQACNCQSQVTSFAYERTQVNWHRLIIYLGGSTPGPATPAIWEIVPFQGTSLTAVLNEAAKYMQNGGCDADVRNVQYERQPGSASDSLFQAQRHIVSLLMESPSSC